MKEFQYMLVVTDSCNLACKYCYVKQNPSVVSTEVIDAFIIEVKNKCNQNYSVSIHVFGGEPLLAKDKVYYLIDSLNQKIPNGNYSVTIFTNGILLDESLLKYTKKFPWVRYNFSLDGCEKSHNAARIYKNGSGSFNDVLKGIELYRSIYQKQISSVYVISPTNVQYLVESCQYYTETGLTTIAHSVVRDDIWTPESLDIYKQQVTQLADFYIENIDKNLNYRLFTNPILGRGQKVLRYCSTHDQHLCITPTGDLYLCPRFYINGSGYKFGTIFDGIDKSNIWTITFGNYTTKNILGCSTCDTFKNNDCMGQCIAACYEASGNFLKPISTVCEILKFNHKISQYIYNQLKNNPIYQKTIIY